MFDDVTGLQWNINRWYDPNVGRWVSEDPIGFEGKDYNTYRYGHGMPIGYTDAYGHMSDQKRQEYCDIFVKDNQKELGNLFGFMVCFYGDIISCVNEDAFANSFPAGTTPTAGDVMRNCTREHEDIHISQVTNPSECGPCSLFEIDYGMLSVKADEAECIAYRATAICLMNGKGLCANDANDPAMCVKEIDFLLSRVIEERNTSCMAARLPIV